MGYPIDALVVSICSMATSQIGAFNVIPDAVDLVGTVRSFRYMSGAVLFMLTRRLVEGTAGWLVALACGIDVGPEFIALVIASFVAISRLGR